MKHYFTSAALLFQLLIIAVSLFASCSGNQKKEPAQASDSIVKVKMHHPGSDVRDGDVEERFPNGIISIKGYKMHGKREGLWRSWYENGQLNSELSFIHGKREGPYHVWYDNGKKMTEGMYKQDIEVGKWKHWDKNGNFVAETDYDHLTPESAADPRVGSSSGK
jgi:hypothetical protein